MHRARADAAGGRPAEYSLPDNLPHRSFCGRCRRRHRSGTQPQYGLAKLGEISAVIERCPSGALQYRRLDGAPNEQTGPITTVAPVKNGPLALRGDLVVRHKDGTHERLPRAVLCRCGHSKNKPFCDNSHVEAGFLAAGATPAEILSDVSQTANPVIPT
jgi:CDGSH-type Zn-finger protein